LLMEIPAHRSVPDGGQEFFWRISCPNGNKNSEYKMRWR
jgi:hypothetical protein